MNVSKFLQELLVVIVLFKQKPEAAPAYTSLQAALESVHSFPEIFIYDNSPEPSQVDRHIIYVHDARNNGVSRAYNEAAAYASAKNKNWMLLLDQDTTIDAALFEQWIGARLAHPGAIALVPVIKDRHGIISPFDFSSGRGKRLKDLKEIFSLLSHRFINSGLFIQRDAFISAGGYDERIPLDFSDISFGERLLKITDHFVVLNTSLAHDLSSTGEMPLSEALRRFHYFSRGSMLLGNQPGRYCLFLFYRFLRAVHLSFHYKNANFIRIFFQHCLHG